MKRNLLFTLFLVAVSVLTFGQKIPFQGKLIESGTPVDGTRTFVFEIPAVGWSETHSDVTITDGLYFVVLGSIEPLPDSLFYGVTEQSMAIAVDGTALSEVTLFKPLSSPFEGSELTVRNDEDTIVGRFFARSDSLQSGELLLNGPNGLPNVRIGNLSTLANDGEISIHDTEGNRKGSFYSNGDNSTFFLSNKNGIGASIQSSMWNGNEYSNLNLSAMRTGVASLYANSYQDSNGGDTIVSSSLNLSQYNRSQQASEFRNFIRPDAQLFIQGNRQYAQYRVHDWEGKGYSAFLQLMGPNTMNMEMGGRFWNNSDLPYFKMHGSQDQYALEMSLYEDSTETAYINLNSLENKEAHISSNGIRFNRNGENWWEFASINVENRDGYGDAGYFSLSGPTTGNIHLGTRHWEGTSDLPLINLHGENDFHGMELSIVPDGNGDQYGFINLMSENGKNLHLSPEGFGLQNVGMNSQIGIDSMIYGYLFTRGPNTTNFETGGDWNNPDRAYLNLNGATDENRIRMAVYEDEQQNEFGSVDISGSNQKLASIQPYIISLNRTGDNWREFANLNMWENPDTGTGMHGTITLNGPESLNFRIRSRDWENANLPQLALYGENDFEAMELSVLPDENGNQYGFINLWSENGKNLYLSPNGFGVEKISLNTVNENGVSSGEIFLQGNNTPNIQMGGQPWDNNHDLGFFTVFTDKPDGNGGYYGAAGIYANTNGTDSWGRISLSNNGEERVLINGENGKIDLSSQDAISFLEPHVFSIVNKSDPNNWRDLASMGINNDNGSWVGTVAVSGPNSGNVYIGSQQNPDLPWITLQGTEGFEAMQIGAVDDATQRGFIRMVNKQSGEEMFYSSHGVGGNTPFQVSGGLSVDGFITLNGDTLNLGVSDRRYKTNIQSLGDDVMKKVELVNGVSYDWRKDEFPEKHFTNAKQIGVIAQELEAQFPELVKTNAEGYKSVNYDGLSAVLIEAVKELNAKVEKLETENSQLKAELSASASNTSEIEALKAQMDALVKLVHGQAAPVSTEEITSTPGLK
ncbi:tail fiber domain-containing protein [Maribellus mangrovi]|uniref:tail fiber domain-containing protein n=1 Tax=Maribellus mangrovi TaxID=3133146 RepID=UPI0030EEFB42